jgi:hypothetical protein
MRKLRVSLALVAVPLMVTLPPDRAHACTVTLGTGAMFSSISAAVAQARTVETVQVDGSTGPCNENVLVDNTHLRMIISGVNGATISPASTGAGLDLRVKGVMVQGVTVNGGLVGIVIQRNANAIIDNVTVQSTTGPGIVVTSMAFAVITNSRIQNTQSQGIVVSDLASANIGINEPLSGAYAPNVIQGNATGGINVSRNATARIFANTIASNGDLGINVNDGASVRSGGNMISGNRGGGISVARNATAQIGISATQNMPFPEQTTSANQGFGVGCSNGGVVYGHLGSSNQINGTSGQFGFDPTCPNGTGNLVSP